MTSIQKKDGINPIQQSIKRIFDIIVSGFCIIVFSPLFIICWLAVRLEDGGCAIFKQERIGKGGKPFFIYKFRSMSPNAEEESPLLAQEDDERLTKVGRFLRNHHLDELPQLWNVFKGDMSFIGYRPERKYFIDQIIERDSRYEELYAIRPGVTSYATLHNGYTDTIDKMLVRLEMDLEYLHNWSILTDCKILLQTFQNIVGGKKF